MKYPIRRTALSLLAAALSATLLSCAVNPVTGERNFVMMTEKEEIELGKKSDPQVRQQYSPYDNAALQAYVQQIGEKLAVKSHRANLIYRFTVLDSDEVNAFALPGGYIYITRGIMAYLNSEAELAAVLGHEIGHVTARHSVRQYSAATATGLVIGILGGGAAGQSVMNVLGSALLSGYGREHELESDRLGAEYLARNGYDPDAMIDVVGVLKNQEEAEKKRAEAEKREARSYHGVFASHPSADKRLQEVVAEAKKFKTSTTSRVGREEYLKLMDGVVFGDSVREGIRRGSDFYHRDLNFAFSFPSGWRVQNTPKAVNAAAPDKNALMQLTMEEMNKRVTPQEYLRERVKTNTFKDEAKLEGSPFPSHTAIVRINTPFGVRDARVAVLFNGDRAFVLFGTAKDEATFRRLDPQFQTAMRSLHTLSDKERAIAAGLKLRVVKARAGDTFAELAKRSPLNTYAELTLRLINDKFPIGEPVAGESIKIIE
ncbi:MAG TPA: M48 family metalloprotease [Burkholderiales bacterium]|nr:M48 family metalloprotease [Burkholderiales bacterium]